MTTSTRPLRLTPDSKLRTNKSLRRTPNAERIAVALHFRGRMVTVTYVPMPGVERIATGRFVTAAYLDHGTTHGVLVLDTGAIGDSGKPWAVPFAIPLSQIDSIVEFTPEG